MEKAIQIEDTHLLPSEVVGAKYVELDMLVDYNFSVSAGSAHISEGFLIDFPDWMTIVKADESNDIEARIQNNVTNYLN